MSLFNKNNSDDKSQETEKPFIENSSSKISVVVNNRSLKRRLSNEPSTESNSLESLEDELQCAICKEMFINPVTLSCTHTFCKYCIERWRQNHFHCPICRCKITTQFQTRVLINFIDKILEKASNEVKQHRLDVIEQRQAISSFPPLPIDKPLTSSEANSVSVLTTNSRRRTADYGLIEASFEDTSGEGSDYDNFLSDDIRAMRGDFDVNCLYPRQRRCYTWQRGYWGYGCPYKRRRFY
ncbi:hypothetical protein ILUMI_09151 [Ignelater luminosus]|uniref:RING-type domain-containing protein n=1 Tax=Ignelater luminosus TaxID=2038154 RepID=A0A8K0D0D2_IGNLU|nr:hypothetical protein ILUMI_09151 [Ignelater luminosus]